MSWSTRQTLEKVYAIAGGEPPQRWEIVIASMSDPYLIVFVLVPVLLLLGARRLVRLGELATLIRYRSRSRAVVAHSLGGLADGATLMGAATIGTLIASIGSRSSSSWSGSAGIQVPGNEAVAVMSSTNFPFAALIEQGVCFLAVAMFLCAAQGTVRLWSGSDRATAAFSGLVCVLIVVSFKAGWDLPDLALPINYMVAYHAHLSFGGVWLPIAICFGSVGAVLAMSASLETARGCRRALA